MTTQPMPERRCFRCLGPSDRQRRALCSACVAELEAAQPGGLDAVLDVLLDIGMARLERQAAKGDAA